MKKSQKFLIESGVLLATIGFKARKTGKNLKDYFYEEETIKHISLVLYDLLPLSVKIGMRYQKFHEIFEGNFKSIRNALLGQEEKVQEDMKTSPIESSITVEKKPRKIAVKKTIIKDKVKKNEK